MDGTKCILWSGLRNKWGYGRIRHKGQMRGAHRVMYCKHHGIDIDSIRGLVVRHLCDNPPCVNPAHLILGTHADNMRDKKIRRRDARGIGNGASKLNDQIVAAIRAEYIKGSSEFSQAALAMKYGVSQSVIHAIVNRKTWTHLPDDGRNTRQPSYKGVYHNKKDGRFMARIGVGYKRIHLGTFDTPEEARAAYQKAKDSIRAKGE